MVEQIGHPSPVPFVGPQGFIDLLGVVPVFLMVDPQPQVVAIKLARQRNQPHAEQFRVAIEIGRDVLAFGGAASHGGRAAQRRDGAPFGADTQLREDRGAAVGPRVTDVIAGRVALRP